MFVLTTFTCTHELYIGVSNLRSIRNTNGTITVEWDPANSPSGCEPLYYSLTIVNSVNASDTISSGEIMTRAEFSNLKNGTSYNISVAAVNRVGIGPISTFTLYTHTEGNNICMYVCICQSLATTYLIYLVVMHMVKPLSQTCFS